MATTILGQYREVKGMLKVCRKHPETRKAIFKYTFPIWILDDGTWKTADMRYYAMWGEHELLAEIQHTFTIVDPLIYYYGAQEGNQ